MTPRDPVAMLVYEAKRRPHVQALIDRALTLTDEDIETAQVPLKWYKQALAELRRRLIVLENEKHGKLAIESRYETSVNFQSGTISTYTGPDEFVVFESSGHFPLEIKNGDLLWVTDAGTWYDHLFTAKKLPCVPVSSATKAEYREARQKQLADRYGLTNGEIDNGESNKEIVDSNGTVVKQMRITSAAFTGSVVPIIRL